MRLEASAFMTTGTTHHHEAPPPSTRPRTTLNTVAIANSCVVVAATVGAVCHSGYMTQSVSAGLKDMVAHGRLGLNAVKSRHLDSPRTINSAIASPAPVACSSPNLRTHGNGATVRSQPSRRKRHRCQTRAPLHGDPARWTPTTHNLHTYRTQQTTRPYRRPRKHAPHNGRYNTPRATIARPL